MTTGIEICNWSFPLKNGETCYINFWDFGGQEIYHATHQLFLSKRSLYLLVVDTRHDVNFNYWLNTISLFGGNSPILIIQNEKQDRKIKITNAMLRSQSANLKTIISTNLATDRGISKIKTTIKECVASLPHVGTPMPTKWVKVRKIIEEKSNLNFIYLDEYKKICISNGIRSHKDQMLLSEYFHDLGILLHFQDEKRLFKIIVTNPQWVTESIYKVLDDNSIALKNGLFTQKDIAKIWLEKQYVDAKETLLQIMIKFQLCYKLPNVKNSYIIPSLLADSQPKYNWDKSNNLVFKYSYEFMPKGIISRFIVLTNHLIADGKDVWKSGVVLQKDRAGAEIVENFSKQQIDIRICGTERRELTSIVIDELDKINKSFNNINYEKLIPCNCSTCITISEPYFFDYKKLQEFYNNNQYQIQCRKKPYEMVNVISLLESIPNKEINLSARISINTEFSSSFTLMKEDMVDALEDPNEARQLKKELSRVEKALEEIAELRVDDQKYAKNSSALNRIQKFINKMEDEETRVGMTIRIVEDGINYAQELAQFYNQIAQWCGLPIVPNIFLSMGRTKK